VSDASPKSDAVGTLTPAEIVKELDKYIVGQADAKKAVAVALRNRWRRQRVSADLREDIHPKNILMIGPTGVGKTEIARRLAKIAHAPFLKVEATKYTEVGYVGKDVESMIRDLVEISITMIKAEERDVVLPRAREAAEERILDLLVPQKPIDPKESLVPIEIENSTRTKFREMFRKGDLDEREVQLEMKERQGSGFEILAIPGMEEMDMNLRDMLGNLMPKKTKRRKTKVKDAFKYLEQEEVQRLVDMDRVIPLALERAEQNGIIFLDEMDKIAESREGGFRGGPNVSREGVQRDLLPIIEGSSVNTKYGVVKTDHILFIGAGAFHHTKPSDLFPELQGRFPIRVELNTLTTDDFYRILTEPKTSLIKQYSALMATEGMQIIWKEDAIRSICEMATSVNEKTENIGARRLHTVLERVLEEISFSASDIHGQSVEITVDYVKDRVQEYTKNEDLSRYIL
jgi:ATP-dependent HslUV protease ATP-binding subunit HslU